MLSRSVKFVILDQNLRNNLCNKFNKILTFHVAKYTSEVNVTATPLPQLKTKKISKAMKAYLERAEENGEFMKIQKSEYQIGKRHLANMMGEDPETFTQTDVDRAIEYLFPSGIYDKKARPMMKPPEEIFPARKAAEFDESGRPFHSMFYTGKPNFFKLLYDIVEEINGLYDYEDRMLKKGFKPDPTKTIDLSGFDWVTKEQLEDNLVETIADIEYSNFVTAMNRLMSLPYSYKVKEFIGKYQRPLMDKKTTVELPKPEYDENGRMFITTYECFRKTAKGEVTIRSPGTGKITVNGQELSYFKDMQPREQILFPLIFTDMLEKVDVEAIVENGGPSGQAGAIRWGIAMGLRNFVDADMIEKMRIAGLLTRDYRQRERKKFGQEGARRKYTWKKR